MKNRIFSTYKDIDVSSLEGRKKFFGAITYFLRQPREVQNKLLEAGTTQFTVTGDFADEIKVLIEKLHLGLEELDVGWQQFFTTRDFSGTPAPGFRVREVSSGLTFNKRAEGGRARIYAITGTEAYVSFDTYGGGLEFDQAWFMDQEWWLVEDTAAEFRSAWYRDKAAIMYGLIGAIAAGYNIAYDAVEATELGKDIATINTAAAALLTALKALGYSVTANSSLLILSPIQLKARLNRALAATNLLPGASSVSLQIEYNVQPVYSMNVLNAGAACTDKWYLGLPGLKNKLGEKMPLTVFSDFKIESFVTTTVGWGRYGAYLNPAQFRRLATA